MADNDSRLTPVSLVEELDRLVDTDTLELRDRALAVLVLHKPWHWTYDAERGTPTSTDGVNPDAAHGTFCSSCYAMVWPCPTVERLT